MPPRVLQATPSGYLVRLDDGTTVNLPEHVAVQSGLVAPTDGSQQLPAQTPPQPWAWPDGPVFNGPQVQAAASPDRMHGVNEGRYIPPQQGQLMAANVGVDRGNGVSEGRYFPPGQAPVQQSIADNIRTDQNNGVFEGRYNPDARPVVDKNAPVYMDATEDVARAQRKADHIKQLRTMLGLE